MIHESYYWKNPLLRSSRWLEKAIVDEKTSERIFARAEREIFVGFYAVRKLLETFNLSTKTKALKYETPFFSAFNEANPDYFNRDKLQKHYDLNQQKVQTLDIEFICNQVIHSYIFIFSLSAIGSIEGFYLSSDTMRKKKLFFIPITTISDILRTVGNDYPSDQHLTRNLETGQWTDIESK
ncbi:hypothetical protein BFW87_13015 [Pseudomonas fluorescens]|uniref:Uncharacterized protein n=1 Tax=Pseudomonas fluorescens TaxID=294 RepID=A0A1T2YTN1_PSEFL|nr:hypothetical protein [Pseudomonas fluorescens]OPA94973.1 hypothetical protein BFW87_13015 [Pseudomonas fluorescens]